MSSRRPKKYRCTQPGCSKAYSRPCLLEQHARSHSDIRPFQCDVCQKGFFRDSHLQSHRWTHATEKPLGCTHCDKRFITNQQLQRHEKTHEKKRSVSPQLVDSCETPSIKVETPVSPLDSWKDHLDKMTKEIDSLVYDSPLDEAPSLDFSSFAEHTEYTYSTADKPRSDFQQCPFECPSLFKTTADLSLHMLETHILADAFVTEQQAKHEFAFDSLFEEVPFETGFYDKSTEEFDQFETFVSQFAPHYEQEYEPNQNHFFMGQPHAGHQGGVPEMRYQRTFGSEGHRSMAKAESPLVGLVGEEMEGTLGDIRRSRKDTSRLVRPLPHTPLLLIGSRGELRGRSLDLWYRRRIVEGISRPRDSSARKYLYARLSAQAYAKSSTRCLAPREAEGRACSMEVMLDGGY